MKNWMKTICAGSLVLAVTGFTSQAFAHQDLEGDSCEVGCAKILKCKDKLKLTDGQVERLKDIKENAKEDLDPTVDRLKADVETLKEKLDKNAGNGELSSLLNKIDEEREKLEHGKEKYIQQTRGVLTTRQQAWMVVDIAKKYKEKMEKEENNKNGDEDSDDDDTNQYQTVTPTPDNSSSNNNQ